MKGGNFSQDESLDNQFIVLDNFHGSDVERNTLQESVEQSMYVYLIIASWCFLIFVFIILMRKLTERLFSKPWKFIKAYKSIN